MVPASSTAKRSRLRPGGEPPPRTAGELAGVRPPRAGELPDRVRRAISRQQASAERLITAVQLIFVFVFGALYVLAPKTAPHTAAFEPVPWALGAYTLFTGLRGIVAWRRLPPAWLLSTSVVVDIGLLLGLIWSFHLQYGQAPAFYLKAPTLLYVFIFIALRALRFEVRYVVLAGLTAAVGWGALVAYAIAFHPTGDPITRDYVDHLVSNRILLGAEIDKIFTMLTVTAILGLALLRAQRLLRQAMVEHAAHEDLSRFFDPEVARRITDAEDSLLPGATVTREAAILILDIRGFTQFARRNTPAATVAVLTRYQSIVVPILRRHGGVIDKFLGDGILATFGTDRPNDTHAADAIRGGIAALEAIARWNAQRAASGATPIRVCGAVTHGSVVVGAVGDDTRLEYTVIGDPINVAAKLEQQTKHEGARLLAVHETVECARGQGFRPAREPERLGHRPIAGLEGTVDLDVLLP